MEMTLVMEDFIAIAVGAINRI
ncbi:BnaA02g35800D [Brassica napus]|nr:BnaA02g35800D [Brassica napus]